MGERSFMAALLGDGELDGTRILQPETVELAFSDHLDGIALPAVFESAMPELSHDIPSLPFSQGWGLGFPVHRRPSRAETSRERRLGRTVQHVLLARPRVRHRGGFSHPGLAVLRSGNHRPRAGDRAGYLRGNRPSGLARTGTAGVRPDALDIPTRGDRDRTAVAHRRIVDRTLVDPAVAFVEAARSAVSGDDGEPCGLVAVAGDDLLGPLKQGQRGPDAR
jgi:hypothetical protein